MKKKYSYFSYFSFYSYFYLKTKKSGLLAPSPNKTLTHSRLKAGHALSLKHEKNKQRHDQRINGG